ncbi:MAG: IS30 family transposase [Spirochaetes bacterium]|nr:IS30 family transposase [Spirochaetota bacterium]
MGRKKLSIQSVCKHTHFTWGERLALQYHYLGASKYQKITSSTLLGTLLGKHERTIRRELKRGMVLHELGDEPFERWEYNADHAQNDADRKSEGKGPEVKLGRDWALVGQVSEFVRERHYSPYAIIQHFQTKGWPSETRICEKTLYSYIAAGDITGISGKDLLLRGKRRKPRGRPARHSRAANAARSIDTRPEQINDRSQIGHWEMDTVYSGKEGSPACLLTLTERKTRVEITRKIPDRTAESVRVEFDAMERQIGSLRFRTLFKSITADNGGEFSDVEALEGSSLCAKPRTQLYFAHPYCSSERGTNENHNGILRRFIPKAADIGLVSKKAVRHTQDWMNTYPRKILDGHTPLKQLMNDMGEGFIIPYFLEVTV